MRGVGKAASSPLKNPVGPTFQSVERCRRPENNRLESRSRKISFPTGALVLKQAYFSRFWARPRTQVTRAQSALADPVSGSALCTRLSFHHLPPHFHWAWAPTRIGASVPRHPISVVNNASGVAMLTLHVTHPHPAGRQAARNSTPTGDTRCVGLTE